MAAGKDYTVRLDIETSQAISNIDHLLQKVQTLNTSVTDLDNSEIALNVVIRNAGFQNMVANVNKALLQMEKETKKASDNVSNTMSNAFTKSADSLAKPNNGYDKAMKEVAKNVKNTVEGSLKGIDAAIASASKNISKSLSDAFKSVGNQLTDIIADSVTKGMVKGFRGMTSNATKTFNAQNLTFKTNFDQLDEGLGKIRHVAETLDNLLDELAGSLNNIRKLADTLGASDARMLRDMAKGIAGSISKADWSRDNMSLKDRRHAEVEDRRVAIEEKRLLLEEDNHAYNQELDRLKAENQERREAIKLEQELKREERKNDKEIEALQSQQKLFNTENERAQKKLEDEDAKRDMVRRRRAEQLAQIKHYAAREEERDRIQNTDLEKELNNWEQANLRIKQQINSSNRNLAVDESAIAQAAKDQRDAQIRVTQEILRQAKGYAQIKTNAEAVVKSLQRSATSLQRWSSAVSSIGGVLSTFRQLSNSMASVITKAGTTFLGYARQAASSIATAATEQYRQLELAQIGFTNFYGEADAKNLITQIKEQAMHAPGVDAGDLADYVKQLAPVSNGNSQVALDAAMGMLKTIQYGGGEASEEMEYVIKNIRDVIAKGTATAIDLRQFNRAMPIMEDVLESIGKSDFIKNGHLKIDKNNAKELLQAFADINNDPNSPVVDIFEQMSNTLSGITDVIKQTFIARFNDTLINLGFYDKVKEILRDLSDSGLIEKFYTFLANSANKILIFLRSLNWEDISEKALKGAAQIWETIKKSVATIMKTLSQTNLAELIQKVLSMVASFIEGLSDGVNNILKLVNHLEGIFGKDFLNGLSSLMGLAMSPVGKLAQAGLSFAQQGLNFASRMTYNLSTKYQQHVEHKLDVIEKWVANIANTVKYSNSVSEFGRLKSFGASPAMLRAQEMIKLGYGDKISTGGDINKGNYWLWNRLDGSFTSAANSENGTFGTTTGLGNMKFLDRVRTVGDGSLLTGAGRYAKTYTKVAAQKLASGAKKLVKSFAFYEVGNAITAVASNLAEKAGGKQWGETVDYLGKGLSAAIALGSQFGPLGAAAGLVITAFKKLSDEANKYMEAIKDEIKLAKERMYGEQTETMTDQLMIKLREAGVYEAGNTEDEDAHAAAYDAIFEAVKKGKYGTEAMEIGRDAYLAERAKNRAITNFNAWNDNVDLGTDDLISLNGERDKEKIKQLYDLLTNLNWMDEMTDSYVRGVAGNDRSNLTGEEYMNYIRSQGWLPDSLQGLDALIEKTTELTSNIEQDKNVEVNLRTTYSDSGGTYGSIEELLQSRGLAFHDGYGYVMTADLDIVVKGEEKLHKTLHDLSKDLAAESFQKKDWLGAAWWTGASAFTRLSPVGLIADGIWSWLRDLNADKAAGGFVKPIYRAAGGNLPGRGVDTVPTMLQPGEFVMRRSAVSKVGAGVLNALNVGDLSKATQLLGARFTNSWNNSRSYNRSVSTVNKYVTNRIEVNNRTAGGRLNSYNALANRLALGF